MSLLTQYTPHSSLFASPLGVLITQGCLARQSYVNDRQPLVRAAQDLFKHHAQSDIIVGLLPFNTSRAAQLLESKKDQQEHAIVIENIIEALAPFCDSIEAAKTPYAAQCLTRQPGTHSTRNYPMTSKTIAAIASYAMPTVLSKPNPTANQC